MIGGIDHGNHGGICVLSSAGEILELIPMPELNVVRRIARDYDAAWFIEELSIHPKFSRNAICTLARNLGRIEGHFRAYERRITLVRPQAWQEYMYNDARLSMLEGKHRSIAAAEILCPAINLKPTKKTVKSHDGMADAYLIAQYGRMILNAKELK